VAGVGGVADDQHLALGAAQDHRHVAQRVAGREGDADAPVAEQVERAPEPRERADLRVVEVEQPVVEGMVEVARHVAVAPRARLVGDLPLLLAEDERRARELNHAARVIEVEVGHHDQLHLRRLDPARAELGG
jgi:hypothetical protein